MLMLDNIFMYGGGVIGTNNKTSNKTSKSLWQRLKKKIKNIVNPKITC